MSIRTPPRGPFSAGIVPRERVVVPPVRRGSGHCMTGAVTAPAACCGSAGPMDARPTSR